MKRTAAIILTLALALLLAAPVFGAAAVRITYVVADAEKGIRADMVSVNNPDALSPGARLLDALCADKRYRFAGWYADAAYQTRVRSAPDAEAVTLYAKWEPASFSITYDLGGVSLFHAGGVNPNRSWYDPGESLVLEDLTFDSDAFVFGGWFRDAARTKPAGVIGPEDAADLTIYALITEKVYPIYYVLAPENGPVEASRVYHDNAGFRGASQAVTLTDAVVLDVNYLFDGWYTEPEYINPVDEIPAYTTHTVTLYAKWSQVLTYQPVWGDATLSGGLTAADARLALRYSARLEDMAPLARELADIDRSGKVTAADARLILRMSARLESIDELTDRFSLPQIVYRDGAWTLDTDE